MQILENLLSSENIEIYMIVFLSVFTLWFILNTIKYYKGEKRKVKHLHRFAKEGESKVQFELAKRYAKGKTVPKSCQKAAFWYQKAAFSGNNDAKESLDNILRNKHC